MGRFANSTDLRTMWSEWANLTRGLVVAGAIWAVYPLFYWYSREGQVMSNGHMVLVHPKLWEQMKERLSQLEAEVERLTQALKSLKLSHSGAPYEGDGDPGCLASCRACVVEDALNGTSRVTARAEQ